MQTPTPNEDATVDYDTINTYIEEASKFLMWAKEQKTGSSYEAVNLHEVRHFLANALNALSRDLPDLPPS